jgi:hypothetical protein
MERVCGVWGDGKIGGGSEGLCRRLRNLHFLPTVSRVHPSMLSVLLDRVSFAPFLPSSDPASRH